MNTLSNIPKIVSIEFQKARHKHFPLLFLAALLLDCAYLFLWHKSAFRDMVKYLLCSSYH